VSTEVLESPTHTTGHRHTTDKAVIAALISGAALYGVVRVAGDDRAQPSARTVAATGMTPSDAGLALILGANSPVATGGRTSESPIPGPAPATGDTVMSIAGIDTGLGVVFGATAIAAGTTSP
jgi:hypothetical protein